jgi:hypothetical protein
MNTITSVRKEFLASRLRLQMDRLGNILGAIEEESKVDCDYVYESLKKIEGNLRQARKMCAGH